MSVEDQLRAQMGRELTFAEREFIRQMRVCAERGIHYGWMEQVVTMEWKDKEDGPLARIY
jgi:hypothetical protein